MRRSTTCHSTAWHSTWHTWHTWHATSHALLHLLHSLSKGLLNLNLAFLHDLFELVTLKQVILLEGHNDVVFADTLFEEQSVNGFDLGHFLHQRHLILGQATHSHGDSCASSLANFGQLNEPDVFKGNTSLKRLIVLTENLHALRDLRILCNLLHLTTAIGHILDSAASFVIDLRIGFETFEYGERHRLLSLMHLLDLFCGDHSKLLSVSSLQEGASIVLVLIFNAFSKSDLGKNDYGEDLQIFFKLQHTVNIRGDIDWTLLFAHLFHFFDIQWVHLHFLFHLFLFFLNELFALGKIGRFQVFNVLVVVKIVLFLSALQIDQADSMLDVNHVHDFRLLKDDDLLSLLLARNLEILELALCFKLHLDALHKNLLGLLL